MRQAFIVADRDPDPSSISFDCGREGLLKIAVSRAEQSELPAASKKVG